MNDQVPLLVSGAGRLADDLLDLRKRAKVILSEILIKLGGRMVVPVPAAGQFKYYYPYKWGERLATARFCALSTDRLSGSLSVRYGPTREYPNACTDPLDEVAGDWRAVGNLLARFGGLQPLLEAISEQLTNERNKLAKALASPAVQGVAEALCSELESAPEIEPTRPRGSEPELRHG